MLHKFLEIVLDSKKNLSPKRFNRSYFENNNLLPLWIWFEDISRSFPDYSPRHIIILLSKGYDSPPKCVVCGSNAKVQTYTSTPSFDYCSKECSGKSKLRSEKISKTKKSYDESRIQEINHKRSETNLEKTGYAYNSQRPEIKHLISSIMTKRYLSDDTLFKLSDKDWLDEEYNTKKRSAVDIADELNVYYGTVIDYCKKHGFKIRKHSVDSLPQKKIFEFIKENYTGEVLYNDWDTLVNYELDIYIPEFKLAIEHNGLLTHSFSETTEKLKNKHLNKTLLCKERGIDLIHVRGDQWINQKSIVKSMLLSKLGKCSKIYARNCTALELSSNDSKDFLIQNHLQGNFNAKVKLGLYHGNDLVAVMTFGKPRFNSGYSWELIRYANKLNTTVVGGFSKLLSRFKTNYTGSIISYCDYSRSNGNVYLKNGFTLLEKKISPGYYWSDNHTVYNRMQFQKHKLEKILKIYDPNLSETENMINNGFKRYWDCGQLTFIME